MADHAHRLVGVERFQQFFQRAAGIGVGIAAEGRREPAHLLHDLEGVLLLLLADHVAEDAPAQADVVDQGAVSRVGGAGRARKEKCRAGPHGAAC